MTSAALPLSTDGGEGHWAGQAGCCFGKAMLTVLNPFPVLQEPQHSFQQDLFCDLPRHRSGAPRVLLSTFFKNACKFPIFPSPRISPDCHINI